MACSKHSRAFATDPEFSQRMLRHSDISNTEVYIHRGDLDRFEKEKREVARGLEEAIFGNFVPHFVPSGHEPGGTPVN